MEKIIDGFSMASLFGPLKERVAFLHFKLLGEGSVRERINQIVVFKDGLAFRERGTGKEGQAT